MCRKCSRKSSIGRIKKGNFAAGIEPALYTAGGYVGASLLDQVPQLSANTMVRDVVKVVGGIALMAQKGSTTTQLGLGMAVNGLSGLQRQYLPLPNLSSAIAALPGSQRLRTWKVEDAIGNTSPQASAKPTSMRSMLG